MEAPRRLGETNRRDRWWVAPLATALSLAALGVYATVAVALGNDYLYEDKGAHYLSPFYSPDLQSIFGWDAPFSGAFLAVWVPLGLRATCYYYRKAYYRSFFLSPPACAVAAKPRRSYRGEARLPLILQNVHRYFLYLAIVVLAFLWYDAVRSFFFDADGGGLELGVGVGSIVLLLNALFLSAFTFGCNSLRYLVGGRLECFTCSASARTRYRIWKRINVLNLKHKEWAWISLFWVCLADLYIRLASSGAFDDPRIF